MFPRLKGIWYMLTALAFGLSFLYLWFTLFPGQVDPEVWQYFNAEQVERGRAYSQGSRLCFIGNYLTQLCFLLWLAFSDRSQVLSRWTCKLARGNYWINLILFFALLWLILRLLNLPFTLFNSYYWQHHWGFSTQTLEGWWLDYLANAIIELFLWTHGLLLLFWVIKCFPVLWWLYSATCISIMLAFQIFLSPILIAPLFNNFVPAQNHAIIKMVEELSYKAGIPVDQVLIMDASKRTTKSNAYFSGLGNTKQIVLYDTLLYHHTLGEVKFIIAHEMGHWRQGHIMQGLGLYILSIFLVCRLCFDLLKDMFPALTRAPYPVHAMVFIFLLLTLVSFITAPLQGYISQAMEKEADGVAVMLTNDISTAVRLQVNIATENGSDVSPPLVIQWLSSHPSPLTRIQLIQKAHPIKGY